MQGSGHEHAIERRQREIALTQVHNLPADGYVLIPVGNLRQRSFVFVYGMDDAAWGQQRCEGERKCAGPATQIAPCLRTRSCNLVYPNQFGCVSNVHRNLALRAWFLPASRVLSSILKKQHLPASFIFRHREIPKLTGLLEIGNNFTANGRPPAAY